MQISRSVIKVDRRPSSGGNSDMLLSLLFPLSLAAALLGLANGAQVSDDSPLGLQSPRGNGATTHFVLTHKRSGSAPESPRRDTPPDLEKPGHCRTESLTPTALSREGKRRPSRERKWHGAGAFKIKPLRSDSKNHLELALEKEGPVTRDEMGQKIPSPKKTTVFWREPLDQTIKKAAASVLHRGRREGPDNENK